MLPEVILSTKFLKSEILKVQIEARDIPLHADIFGMDISACMFLQWKITKIVEIVTGWQKRSKDENSDLLPEDVLSTKFLKSEIRKLQSEARDIPLHAGIFGMSISICVFLQWHFENNQNRWNRRRVTNTFKIHVPIFNCSKSRHFRCLETKNIQSGMHQDVNLQVQ